MRVQPTQIAATLSLPGPASLLDLSVRCENGLPIEFLHRLAQAISTDEQAFLGAIFSRSTLCRRRQHGKLTPTESDLLVRLTAI